MRNNKLSILMMRSSFPRYEGDSAGASTYRLANKLSQCGVRVNIVTPRDTFSKKSEKINDNMHIYRFQYFIPLASQKVSYKYGMPINLKKSLLAKMQIPLFLFLFLLATLRISKRCDIIHAHTILSGLIAILIKKLFRKTVVLTVHGSDLRIIPKMFSKFVLNNADAVISPHPELTKIIRFLGREDVIEMPNIVDDDKFNPNVDSSSFKKEFNIGNSHIISFIARLDEFKDPITFVKAIPYVLEKIKNIRFFVVGDGILKSTIKEYIKKLDIQEFVTVTGSRSDVNAILRASTIFTALSPIENIWSLVIVEAMKCGVPCIITKSGMTEKYLIHEQHAYLIHIKNEEELANAILYLLEHKELRDKLSKNGIMLMEEIGFSTDDIVRKTLEVYETVV